MITGRASPYGIGLSEIGVWEETSPSYQKSISSSVEANPSISNSSCTEEAVELPRNRYGYGVRQNSTCTTCLGVNWAFPGIKRKSDHGAHRLSFKVIPTDTDLGVDNSNNLGKSTKSETTSSQENFNSLSLLEIKSFRSVSETSQNRIPASLEEKLQLKNWDELSHAENLYLLYHLTNSANSQDAPQDDGEKEARTTDDPTISLSEKAWSLLAQKASEQYHHIFLYLGDHNKLAAFSSSQKAPLKAFQDSVHELYQKLSLLIHQQRHPQSEMMTLQEALQSSSTLSQKKEAFDQALLYYHTLEIGFHELSERTFSAFFPLSLPVSQKIHILTYQALYKEAHQALSAKNDRAATAYQEALLYQQQSDAYQGQVQELLQLKANNLRIAATKMRQLGDLYSNLYSNSLFSTPSREEFDRAELLRKSAIYYAHHNILAAQTCSDKLTRLKPSHRNNSFSKNRGCQIQ